jgi:hypothetical protein
MEKEKLNWILQGILLLNDGCSENQLLEYGVPAQYLNSIRSTYRILSGEN